MDEREAFCIAVKFYRSGEWNPGMPGRIVIEVGGNSLTLRQVCSSVRHVAQSLPDSVVGDLVTSLHSQPDLAKKVATGRTYAIAATCLLCLMDEDESAFRLSAA